MNNLNSVLLEGEVSHIIKAEKREGKKSLFIFKINTRSSKRTDSEDIKTVVSNFEIKTSGRLAEVCIDNLTIGRGVRIVGRLAVKADKEKTVYIQAEHTEFKPVKKIETEEKEGELTCSKQVM